MQLQEQERAAYATAADTLLNALAKAERAPLGIHNIHLKVILLNNPCDIANDDNPYDRVDDSYLEQGKEGKRNCTKLYPERVGDKVISYRLYPNNTVMISIACTDNPFPLDSQEHVTSFFCFLGGRRDILRLWLSDTSDQFVPPVHDWYLTEADLNKDAQLTAALYYHINMTKIQLRTIEGVFREYAKPIDGRFYFRQEKMLKSPIPLTESSIYHLMANAHTSYRGDGGGVGGIGGGSTNILHFDPILLSKGIVALTLAKKTERARALVEQLKDDRQKAHVLSTVVETLCSMGRGMDGVEWSAEVVATTGHTSNTVSAIVMAKAILSAESDELNQILDYSGLTNDVRELRMIAYGFAHAGHFDQALGITEDRIKNERYKTVTLVDIVEVIAKMGFLEKAQEEAEKHIKNEPDKLYALLTVCRSAIEAGNKTIASQILLRLPKLPFSSMRLLQIRAELGLVDQSRELAEKIKNKSLKHRIYAIGYEAQAMANAGQFNEATKLWVTELKDQLIDKPASSSGRDRFYQMLTAGVPFISSIDQGEETLWKIYEAIVEVEGWWTLDTNG